MIDGLRPYPEMKPTGLPWLGKVPSHWDVRKLRHCGSISGGMTPSMADRSLWDGDVPWVTPKDMKRFTISAASMNVAAKALETTSLRLIPAGSVLLVVRGMILARRVPVARTDQPVTINQDMKAIVPDSGFDAGYLAYRMEAAQDAFVPMIDEAGHGTKRFPTDRWKNLQLAVPPLDEQRLIVRFLDWHGARTAKLIRAKKKLIALLNEQKQAIIHRAVTRGLDPTCKLKPSGIPWLGDVPERWEVKPNRVLFSEIRERDCPDEQMLSVTIRHGVIKQQELLENSLKKDSSNLDKSAYKLVCPGDVAYNKMRAWQGAFGVSNLRGIISPAYVVQRPRLGVVSKYFHYLFRTPAFAKESEKWSYGITSDMWSLRPEHFRMIYSPLPPLNDQIAIVQFLEDATTSTNNAMASVEGEIALIQEFRTRLIADVVTGKLDVRAAAAGLSEFTELAPIDESTDDEDLEEVIENEEVAA